MRILRSLVFMIVIVFVHTPVTACEAQLISSGSSSLRFEGFVPVGRGRDLFVQWLMPSQRPVRGHIVLLHGLLDSHRRFDQIQKQLLATGYGVLRLDLFGFGNSLVHELEKRGGDLETIKEQPFESSVTDLKAVLSWATDRFRVSRFTIAGHSMGAALAARLAADPEASLKIRRLILIAPYVYRLEQHKLEEIWNIPFRYWKPLLPGPLLQFWESSLEASIKAYLDFQDPINDSLYLDMILKQRFASHLEDLEGTEVSQTLKIALLTSAIANVKGLRDLNTIDSVGAIPAQIATELVIATNDQLVDPQLQEQLGRAIEQRNGTIHRIESGHMLPTDRPKALLKIMVESHPSREN